MITAFTLFIITVLLIIFIILSWFFGVRLYIKRLDELYEIKQKSYESKNRINKKW